MEKSWKTELDRLAGGKVRWECPLSDYTSFAIGGPATALVAVDESGELQDLLRFFRDRRVCWRIIGGGTNLLVPDAGFDGVVVVLGEEFRKIEIVRGGNGATVRVGAGCRLTRLSGFCIRNGLGGMEFGCGIPGTVGGAVVMNAGAWGKEMADVLLAVTVMTADGPERFDRKQMNFSYRRWMDYVVGETEMVVTGAEIGLGTSDPVQVRSLCTELLRKRRQKQPLRQPNAGSFFKNPAGDSAGRLIDQCGCKGMRVGGAMVSTVHANFLVNAGGATAADVLELMDAIQKKVKEKSGVLLEPEVHFL